MRLCHTTSTRPHTHGHAQFRCSLFIPWQLNFVDDFVTVTVCHHNLQAKQLLNEIMELGPLVRLELPALSA